MSSVVGDVLGAGIGSVANIFSSKTAAKAAKEAAKVSAASATEALNWEKNQYADQQARLQPYRDLGGQAYQRMGQMLGLTNGAPAAGGSFSFRPTPSASGGMVNIRNPRTGEVRAVPAAQAEILKTRGGQVVG